MFGKRYPNCEKDKTKKEEVEQLEEMPYQVMFSDGKREKDWQTCEE